MAKKKKTKKAPLKKKVKKIVKKKAVKAVKKVKARVKPKIQAVKAPKEKLLGRIEHFFDKISVAAISVKAPFGVGDVIHIKGHTTDFVQKIESMQIEHQSVQKVKKGDDTGIKVKDFVRQHDLVYLSDEKALRAKPVQPVKAKVVQQPMFPVVQTSKPAVSSKPVMPASPAATAKPAQSKAQPLVKDDPYENKRFFSF